ncbi:hypothetical protein REPUB_Repub06bG0038100 [Reevesia pubescens]
MSPPLSRSSIRVVGATINDGIMIMISLRKMRLIIACELIFYLVGFVLFCVETPLSIWVFQIPFQLGLSKMDLQKMLKYSLSGVDKSIAAIYKLQKKLTSKELLPSLWDKCKKEFLDKYESFSQLVAKIRELLASM